MRERLHILTRPRRRGVLTALAVVLAVAAVVGARGELAAWFTGGRGAAAPGDPPVAYYTCSMDPSIEADHPGTCPICGMALTPVTRAERAAGSVRVSPATRAAIGLVVATAEIKPLVRRVIASGEVVAPATAADGVAIVARVYRGDARAVRAGQAVHVTIPELPVTQFAGAVAPPLLGDPPDQLRLAVGDPGRALRPGMRVAVQLEIALAPRLVVPAEAVVYAGVHRIAFVERAAGQFEPRAVKLGVTAAGLVEIQDGVAAGDHVVVQGAFLLAADSRLRSDSPLWRDRADPPPVERARPGTAPAPPRSAPP